MRTLDSRIKIKRSTTASEVPTIPTSDDHTDGSWVATDIYKGEFFKNLVDGKLFTRFDSGITEILTEDTTLFWEKDGNTLSSRGTFGSTSGAFGFDFKRNNVTQGGLGDSTGWFWGTTSAFTDTDHSFKGSGNTSATYANQWKNSDNTVLSWLKNDGDFFTKTAGFGGTGNDTGVDLVVFTGQTNNNTKNAFRVRNSDYTTISLWRNDGVAFVKNLCVNTSVGNGDDFNNTAAIFYAPNTDTGSSQAGWFRKADYSTILKLIDNGNIGIGGTSFGSGAGVVFIANAGTDASGNPTGGAILQAKSGRLKVMETDGSLSWLLKAASATKTTAGAPYTNDGYIEVIIDGNTFKLMTTA